MIKPLIYLSRTTATNQTRSFFVIRAKSERKVAMTKLGWMVGTFLVMYLIATILGFATYLLLTPTVMWISVSTTCQL